MAQLLPVRRRIPQGSSGVELHGDERVRKPGKINRGDRQKVLDALDALAKAIDEGSTNGPARIG